MSAQDQQVRLLSRLILKHEDQLAALRRDTQFVFFFRQDDKSILPSLMTATREWKERQAAGDQSIASSQTTVINCLLREVLARTQKVIATESGREALRKADWLDSNGAWTYLRWAPKQRKLVKDDQKAPLVHDEAIRIITELQKMVMGDLIQKFQSTVNLAKLEDEGAQQAVFGISLRGSTGAQHEGRRPPEAAAGTTAGTTDVRRRPIEGLSHIANPEGHAVPASPACNTPWVLPFTLRNPRNHCYLNSFVYSAAIIERIKQCVILPSSFRDPGARLLDAHHLLKFHLLGWRHPYDQHDVVELIGHRLPRQQPQHSKYTWSARPRLGEGMRVHSRAELTK